MEEQHMEMRQEAERVAARDEAGASPSLSAVLSVASREIARALAGGESRRPLADTGSAGTGEAAADTGSAGTCEGAADTGSAGTCEGAADTGSAGTCEGAADTGSFALCRVLRPDDPTALVAVRVLGADALAPYRLAGHVPVPEDSLLVGRVLDAFPSEPGCSEVSRWRHHGLVEAARVVLPTGGGAEASDVRVCRTADIAVPDAGWVREAAPDRLPRLVAQLAALAVPDARETPLGAELDARALDLSYAFADAVRRGDWREAAGVGRWLALLPGAPSGLPLGEGLDGVRRGAGGDPWVLLQVAAAHLLPGVRT
ncbi:hypothetical protein AB0J21_04905 [Streptomyces sp. NPDC049954]|uniref:hypothetical protein n=1 Tax=Streptomyces sp. NPDC049954 TaxID=3155779 RepID=UPI003441AA72